MHQIRAIGIIRNPVGVAVLLAVPFQRAVAGYFVEIRIILVSQLIQGEDVIAFPKLFDSGFPRTH
ncbi:hypothetical protein D3C80_2104620 [compost metagenome]